jgi:hypothetical protein
MTRNAAAAMERVPIPGAIAADLIMVEPGLFLRSLEALLDRPPAAGDRTSSSTLVALGPKQM